MGLTSDRWLSCALVITVSLAACATPSQSRGSGRDGPRTASAGESSSPGADSRAARAIDLEKRVAENPDDAQTLLAAGLLHEELGDRNRAQQYLGRAWRAGAAVDKAMTALVRVSIALHDYRGALRYGAAYETELGRTCALEAGAACLRLSELRVLLGRLCRALGDLEAARTKLARAIDANSREAEAYLALADLEATEFGNVISARDTLTAGIASLGAAPEVRNLHAALAQLPAPENPPMTPSVTQ